MVRNLQDILKPLGLIVPRTLQNVTEVQKKILNIGPIKKKKSQRFLRSGYNTRMLGLSSVTPGRERESKRREV